jgi:hypothetical protein
MHVFLVHITVYYMSQYTMILQIDTVANTACRLQHNTLLIIFPYRQSIIIQGVIE